MGAVTGDLIHLTGRLTAEQKELGWRWNQKTNDWVIPATLMNATAMLETDPSDPTWQHYVDQLTPLPTKGFGHPDLYDFQRVAVARLANSEHGHILCASPGLGKTASAIVAADYAVEDGERVVVVAPASLLENWRREIERWSVLPEVYVIDDSDYDWQKAKDARWLVVSWERMVAMDESWGTGWPLWILDESVMTKSRRSQRYLALRGGSVKKKGVVTKSFRGLRKGIDRIWLLSGSPTSRYNDDLWAQLNLIWPRAFPSYWRFTERYCVVEENKWSGSKSVVGNREGMNALADNADLVTVIQQEDVHSLPELQFEVWDVPLTDVQRDAYETMRDDFLATLGSGRQVLAESEIAKLIRLQQITSCFDGHSAKAEALMDNIADYPGPYLIWTHWAETGEAVLEALRGTLGRVELVTGKTTRKDKDARIEAYKAGHVDALILSIGVGKFGHTLINSRTIFYVDKTWSADDYFQSLYRVRRIGLQHSPLVITLRSPGTTDELIEDNLTGKIPGISKMTRADIATLLKGLGVGDSDEA